jgi:Flp pilus assembly pilin Flp
MMTGGSSAVERLFDLTVEVKLIPRSTPMAFLRNFWHEEQGQDLIEYTLLMAFVALASAALFIGAGTSIKGIWSVTNSQLAAASTQAS